jgi:hypothetical protein
MRKQIQLAAVTAAVTAAFAGSAQAATPIYGTGASAVQKSILYIIAKDYCSSASAILYYDNATSAPTASTVTPSGSIFRLQCTPVSASKFASGLDITYDSAGGSWKALTATTPALWANAQNSALNANPVSTVTPGTGTSYGTLTPTILGTTFTFTYFWNNTTASLGSLTSTSVTFGLTDVEDGIFADNLYDQPLVNGSWNTGAAQIYSGITPGSELGGFPIKAFGVTFGVAASPALYTALQKDQVATGQLPASCSSSYGVVGSATNTTCVPFISKAQYASIVSANFGALNTSAAPLFQSIVPGDTSLEVARRDQGSGTQAASNAYFLNTGCASAYTEASDLAPALPIDLGVVPATNSGTNPNGFQVSYNASTGSVITRLAPVAATAAANPGVSSGFVIGVVSAEKDGALGTGVGFLRLEGAYPSNTNLGTTGLYHFGSTENLHANPNASGDGLTFVKDLGGLGTAPANEVITNYSGTGIVNVTTSNYNNNGLLCGGWRHI